MTLDDSYGQHSCSQLGCYRDDGMSAVVMNPRVLRTGTPSDPNTLGTLPPHLTAAGAVEEGEPQGLAYRDEALRTILTVSWPGKLLSTILEQLRAIPMSQEQLKSVMNKAVAICRQDLGCGIRGSSGTRQSA